MALHPVAGSGFPREAGINPASGVSPHRVTRNARATAEPSARRMAVATTCCESGQELDLCINSLAMAAHSMTSPSGEHPTMETKPQECSWVCRLSSALPRALAWLKCSQASKLLFPPLPPMGWGEMPMQGPYPVLGAALPCTHRSKVLCCGINSVVPAKGEKIRGRVPSFSLSPSLAGGGPTSGCSRD